MTLNDQGRGSRLSLFAKHAAKYYAVGASGVLVNLALLFYLTEFVGLWYFLSYTLAISASITSNFILNKLWTFRESIDSQKNLGNVWKICKRKFTWNGNSAWFGVMSL